MTPSFDVLPLLLHDNDLVVRTPSSWYSPGPRYSQAAESITKISAVLSQEQIEQSYIPLVQRLSRGEWFTSRTSSCALYGPAYDKVAVPIQDELRRAFTVLASDDTPMVRRAAAKWLAVCTFCVPYPRAPHVRCVLIDVDLCVAPGEELLEATRPK